MRVRVAEENWFFYMVWRNGYRYRDMFPYPSCGICVSEGFLLDKIDSKSNIAKFFKGFCSLVCLIPKKSSLSKRVSRMCYTFLGWTFFTRSVHVVKCRSKLIVLLQKVSQLGQRKNLKTALMLFAKHMWLLYLCSRTPISYFCTVRRASSPTMVPSTVSISYTRLLRVSRSSTVGISFMWTASNWSGLSPSNFEKKKLKNFEVSSSCRWFPCMWRARAGKRQKLSLFECLVFS